MAKVVETQARRNRAVGPFPIPSVRSNPPALSNGDPVTLIVDKPLPDPAVRLRVNQVFIQRPQRLMPRYIANGQPLDMPMGRVMGLSDWGLSSTAALTQPARIRWDSLSHGNWRTPHLASVGAGYLAGAVKGVALHLAAHFEKFGFPFGFPDRSGLVVVLS
jgi:hypothetical protein